MVCGECGTDVKPGFSVCPACGAEYLRHMGCVGQMMAFLAVPILMGGALVLVFTQERLLALLLIAVGVGMPWMIYKRSPYKWERRQRR